MEITFDAAKNEKNIRERELDFQRAEEFEFATAILTSVFRKGEFRIQGIGYYQDRLHVLCFKETELGIRVISFRKANVREAKRNGFELRR